MRDLYIPLAILIGSVIIGIAVYLGLSSRVPGPVAALSAVPAAPPVAAKPAAITPDQKQVFLQQVGAAIDASRPGLQDACPQKPGKTLDRFVLIISFNADGQEIGRGIADMQGNQHPDLGGCLIRALPNLTIPPPGNYVTVEAPFSYP